MKHFVLKINGIRRGEGVELQNGTVVVEFDNSSSSVQYVNLDALKKTHLNKIQGVPTLNIEWTETNTDAKLDELTKLVQQILLTMPRNYTYTYNPTVNPTVTWSTNEEAIKRNTIAALASALKNIYWKNPPPVQGSDWLAAELYEQGIIASNKCMTDE